MENSSGSRLKRAWNAFLNKDPTYEIESVGNTTYYRPDRVVFSRGVDRTIAAPVYNKIAIDVAQLTFQHVRLDNTGRFVDVIDDDLNKCLTVSANIDQTGRALFQDIVMSMLDEGCVAIVPYETDGNPEEESYKIYSLRTGKIIEWAPLKVKVRLYNEWTGQHQDVWMSKSSTCIVENPLYSIVNEPNSTMQRLIRKLSLLDFADEQSVSRKLNLIIQLPYVLKTEDKKRQADKRREEIMEQLVDNPYGIAYTDGTEHITQLNRPLENDLMGQIEYLTSMLYSQLGITQSILDGTADENVMANYYSRTIEPIATAIVDEMKRKFLSKTARTQKQSITFFKDPFKLVPVGEIADMADKFTRNEIMTSNEFRQVIGMRLSDDPGADELRNKNISQAGGNGDVDKELEQYLLESGELDAIDQQLDELEGAIQHGESLEHAYSSKYYDPEYAHRYYEEHKKLKGRSTTQGLNQKGREAAALVKSSINKERDSKLAETKSNRDSTLTTAREDRDSSIARESANYADSVGQHIEQTNKKIIEIQEQYSKLSDDQKSASKESMQKQIKALRTLNQQKRAQLSEAFRAKVTGLRGDFASIANSTNATYRTTSQNIKDEATSKYEQELAAIKSDPRFKATTKSS